MDEICFIVSRHLDYSSKFSITSLVQTTQPFGLAIITQQMET